MVPVECFSREFTDTYVQLQKRITLEYQYDKPATTHSRSDFEKKKKKNVCWIFLRELTYFTRMSVNITQHKNSYWRSWKPCTNSFQKHSILSFMNQKYRIRSYHVQQKHHRLQKNFCASWNVNISFLCINICDFTILIFFITYYFPLNIFFSDFTGWFLVQLFTYSSKFQSFPVHIFHLIKSFFLCIIFVPICFLFSIIYWEIFFS